MAKLIRAEFQDPGKEPSALIPIFFRAVCCNQGLKFVVGVQSFLFEDVRICHLPEYPGPDSRSQNRARTTLEMSSFIKALNCLV